MKNKLNTILIYMMAIMQIILLIVNITMNNECNRLIIVGIQTILLIIAGFILRNRLMKGKR